MIIVIRELSASEDNNKRSCCGRNNGFKILVELPSPIIDKSGGSNRCRD